MDEGVGRAEVDPDVAGEQAEDAVEHSEGGPLWVVRTNVGRLLARNVRGDGKYSRGTPMIRARRNAHVIRRPTRATRAAPGSRRGRWPRARPVEAHAAIS